MKKILISMMILLMSLTLVGCFKDEVTITFDVRGGEALEDLKVERGHSVELPVPTKAESVFIGWFDSETHALISRADTFDFDLTVYAKYEAIETLPYNNQRMSTNPIVTIEMIGYGIIQIELFPLAAPNTVDNFIRLIQDGYYNDLAFHRIIEGFMIQGGIGEEATCGIAGEFNTNGFTNTLSHRRGVISMARTQNLNSASSQFFIVHEDATFLDGQYAGFGGVISGFSVLDAVAAVQTAPTDAPLEPVLMGHVSVDTKGIVYNDPVCYE